MPKVVSKKHYCPLFKKEIEEGYCWELCNIATRKSRLPKNLGFLLLSFPAMKQGSEPLAQMCFYLSRIFLTQALIIY